jgi:hypothetical protein
MKGWWRYNERPVANLHRPLVNRQKRPGKRRTLTASAIGRVERPRFFIQEKRITLIQRPDGRDYRISTCGPSLPGRVL